MPHDQTTAALGRRGLLAALPCIGAASLLAFSRAAAAQPQASAEAWPERRVRLITPATPGSSFDLIIRTLAERLAARWGQPVVVEGRPGADGIPALEAMLAAPPGEALFSTNHGVVTVTPILHPRLGFDPMAEPTCVAAHLPPRAVRTARAFSAAATPRRLATPLSCTWRITGTTFSVKRRAASAVRAAPSACASARLVRLPSRAPRALRAASAARVRRSACPGRMGIGGAAPSAACICGFSSTRSTNARSGGAR